MLLRGCSTQLKVSKCILLEILYWSYAVYVQMYSFMNVLLIRPELSAVLVLLSFQVSSISPAAQTFPTRTVASQSSSVHSQLTDGRTFGRHAALFLSPWIMLHKSDVCPPDRFLCRAGGTVLCSELATICSMATLIILLYLVLILPMVL